MYIMQSSVLKEMINPGERIVWWGKPNRLSLIFEAIFCPFAIFALCWGAIDMFITISGLTAEGNRSDKLLVIPFMTIHMFPVWIYISLIVRAILRSKKMEYAITDKMFYYWNGSACTTVQLAECYHISYKQGFWDKKFNVGDICFHYRDEDIEDMDEMKNISDFKNVFIQVRQTFLSAMEQREFEQKRLAQTDKV